MSSKLLCLLEVKKRTFCKWPPWPTNYTHRWFFLKRETLWILLYETEWKVSRETQTVWQLGPNGLGLKATSNGLLNRKCGCLCNADIMKMLFGEIRVKKSRFWTAIWRLFMSREQNKHDLQSQTSSWFFSPQFSQDCLHK